jgi:hypothetical protein
MKNSSFIDKESYCQFLFDQNGPYWHIATPGNLTEILFTTTEEYRFGLTLSAVCTLDAGIKVYAIQIMNNHLHLIARAHSPKQCIEYLKLYSKRLKRWAASRGKILVLPDMFVCEPLPIDNLQLLRNSIVYTHRNRYVVDSSQTPFSSPWGSGVLYFGPDIDSLKSVKFNDLSYKDKRLITCSRNIILPDYYTVRNGCISPESFCDWQTGRAFFRSAHQYFNMLTKNFEAYAEFSNLLGDAANITDEELYSYAISYSKQVSNVSSPALLPHDAKLDLARKLHFDYHSNNSQIRRILKIEPSVLESMFPTPR